MSKVEKTSPRHSERSLQSEESPFDFNMPCASHIEEGFLTSFGMMVGCSYSNSS
jgi:hypothetical protein